MELGDSLVNYMKILMDNYYKLTNNNQEYINIFLEYYILEYNKNYLYEKCRYLINIYNKNGSIINNNDFIEALQEYYGNNYTKIKLQAEFNEQNLSRYKSILSYCTTNKSIGFIERIYRIIPTGLFNKLTYEKNWKKSDYINYILKNVDIYNNVNYNNIFKDYFKKNYTIDDLKCKCDKEGIIYKKSWKKDEYINVLIQTYKSKHINQNI